MLIDDHALRRLIEATVEVTVERIEADRARLKSRLAYTEPEAAALLGVRPHVLRDARLRGEITATRIGKRVAYERGELLPT